MIEIFVYDKNTGVLEYSDFGSVGDVISSTPDGYDFTLTPPPDHIHVWRWVDDKWEELLPINNPDIPYGNEYIWNEEQNQWDKCPVASAQVHLENQATMWEKIKERRLQEVTSGVYVESVDKWFHTDEVSSTTYSMIAGMIALNNYEPVQWKVMDNTWLLLTEPLFKELQTAISTKTNDIYAIAEQYKAAMLLADNPLEYDFSGEWAKVSIVY